MRRLIIEVYGKELEKRLEGILAQDVRLMELVHLLRNDQSENVAIWRITLKEPGSNIEDCFKQDAFTKELTVLEREEDDEEGPSFLVFLRRQVRPGLLLGYATKSDAGYLLGPMGLKDGRLTFTFVGTLKQARSILEGVEERGMRYRVVSLTDADFAEDSLLNRLTDKQRRILILAYKLGYFDVPKKVNSDELAARLHLDSSTVVEHLSKAEHRLLAGILDGN
jgi:hypothetical protein